MVTIKPGVKLSGLRPEMCAGLNVIVAAFAGLVIPLTITSALDGEHAAHSPRHPRSLHYEGLALDLRLPSRTTLRTVDDARVAQQLRDKLGPEFDVVLEADHLHVEWDPKPAPAA